MIGLFYLWFIAINAMRNVFLYIKTSTWIYSMSHKSGAIGELGYLTKYGKM
jgi:hypothetical protein